MRSSKSRSRSKSNRNRNSLGNVVNRVFDSSGPEGKVRGTPQQIIDKYNQLARDASLGNDRVAMENFQQHAEHYMRMLSEAQRDADQRREQQERENRERQSQRDKERAEREAQKSSNRDDSGSSDNNSQSGSQGGGQQQGGGKPRDEQQASSDEQGQTRKDPLGNGNQGDDVIDMGENADSGLVETPENRETPAAEEKPKKPRRTRKKAEPAAEGDQPQGDAKPAPKPRSRSRAKPKDDAPAPDTAEQ